MALNLIEWPLPNPQPVAFEPKRRFPCPAYQMEPWLPPADHAEVSRRAAAIGITAREYAMQAVRFAMAQERAA